MKKLKIIHAFIVASLIFTELNRVGRVGFRFASTRDSIGLNVTVKVPVSQLTVQSRLHIQRLCNHTHTLE